MKHKENIFRLRAEGKSYREIQNELGCSKSTIAYHLGEGQKEKTRYRTRGLRGKVRDYIIEYKESSGCIDCKEKYPYYMLDFDHIRDKKFNLSSHRKFTLDMDLIKEEISKCEVVCANCHRIRTHQRTGKEK